MHRSLTMKPSRAQRASSLVLCGLLALTLMFATGCFTHEHVIGDGAQQGLTETQKVWYVAFGLAPITDEPDVEEMAEGAEDYTITTQQTFVDGLIYTILGGLVGPRTVTVTR